MNLAEAAAAARAMAERCEASLARDCAQAMAGAALTALKSATPVRSGRLRASETIDSVSGGGSHATAVIAPHTVYAEFRNRGGTIHVRNARVLTDGVSFFGRSVTQAGSHYMERGEALGRAPAEVAARMVAGEYIRL